MEFQTSTFKTKEEIIADYLSIETTLIPLKGKVPTLKNWTSLEWNENQKPSDFSGNYGIKLEEEDLVIDYDPRNDHSEGRRAFQNLVDYLQMPFDTYTVRTGSGGLHVYLKKPIEFKIRETLYNANTKEGDINFSGLEFKSYGRQVVGPMSVHPETDKLYEIVWKKPSDDRMEAPEELLELIKRDENELKGIDLTREGMEAFSDDDQTVGRFVDYLLTAPPAIEGSGGDLQTYKIACRGRDYNLSPQKVFELMINYYNPHCVPQWEDKDLWVKVKSAYSNNKDIQGKWSPQLDFDIPDVPEHVKKLPAFIRDKQGNVLSRLSNVLLFMELKGNPIEGLLRYNLFTRSIEFKSRAPWHYTEVLSWSDEDAIHFRAWLSDAQKVEVNPSVVHEAALLISMRYAYHPVKDYLESLKWDGVKRLGNWISTYCDAEENIYTRAIGEKVLLGAISRIYEPGEKFDYVLIIEGPQGVGKSTLVNILGKYWYGDIIIDPHNKDTVDALKGKWIIEISEMECTKREVNALKSFITRRSDRVRPAYARNTMDYPRQCVFVGTINPEHGKGYLKDTTGNRRFWPVYVKNVDFQRFRKDIDQIWAEALHVFKTGKYTLYLDSKELEQFAERVVSERFEADPFEDVIGNYLYETKLDIITSQEIVQDCLMMPISKFDKFLSGRIACAMHRLGYANTTRRIDGRPTRCYTRITENSKCPSRYLEGIEPNINLDI